MQNIISKLSARLKAEEEERKRKEMQAIKEKEEPLRKTLQGLNGIKKKKYKTLRQRQYELQEKQKSPKVIRRPLTEAEIEAMKNDEKETEEITRREHLRHQIENLMNNNYFGDY